MEKLKQFLDKLLNPTVIILFAVTLRLVPHPPNFAPIAAMALFGGAYLNRKYAIVIPLVVMFLSDIFIGFYSPVVMTSVYGSFVLVGLLGMWLKKRKSPGNVIAAAIGSSLLFFLITNFAVWAAGAYARDLSGLAQSYVMGLPFFRNTLLGDLFYTGVFFGGYELVKSLAVQKRPSAEIIKS
ncbi:MAG: hypothetical protein A2134_00930 [Candidatus Woykebacteria bacterium RBG_16_39_9b]|uniref:Rod shape-determining protein MreD n=1 Tax=Candidatus Woykebacteria bacterium RBG_16_39_9b TaxID=1802595 RepID=A0A1G1WEU8_9BACT|nr:MAG: hypothetical protein A2134_00930 [Candidatus Woykebacteria bacterium RBG_16_39_9b]